ncbi:peptide deformylase [uncultured Actinomyces sp.]|jgi:peptide deformylase|uniref:peptide deformylase n=1 Tax=uncultured Actinomyces sp. TaxID=249061 RepID=UPI00325FBFB6
MTILPIYITGEPILHRVADPVESFDSTLRDLVADMIETMHAAPGVGLAAPQVGVGLQLFVWSYRGGGAFDRRYKDILGLNDGAARSYNSAMSGVVVNPTLELVWDNDGVGAILPTQPDMTNESEGCLSVPGVQYPLRRALGAILRGYDADGNTVQASARGWLARIFQHEYDHLRGTLYVDRLDTPYREDSRAYVAERGWGSSGCTWTPGERA